VRLKLNGTDQLLACPDYVNLLEDNIDTFKIKRNTFIDATREVGLGKDVGKTKYLLLSRHQNAEHHHDVKAPNRSSRMWYSQMHRAVVTNQNLIQGEIKRILTLVMHATLNSGLGDSFERTTEIQFAFSGRAVAPNQQENSHFFLRTGE
jgi:hypothetical protein